MDWKEKEFESRKQPRSSKPVLSLHQSLALIKLCTARKRLVWRCGIIRPWPCGMGLVETMNDQRHVTKSSASLLEPLMNDNQRGVFQKCSPKSVHHKDSERTRYVQFSSAKAAASTCFLDSEFIIQIMKWWISVWHKFNKRVLNEFKQVAVERKSVSGPPTAHSAPLRSPSVFQKADFLSTAKIFEIYQWHGNGARWIKNIYSVALNSIL
jgi:hypothetical protein